MPRKTKENQKLINKNITTSKPKTESKKTIITSTTSKKASSTSKTTKNKTTTSEKKSTKAKTTKTSTPKKKTQTKKTTLTTTEYYDLPQNYNQTIVKILAQTPKTLFIYWEISDTDIENYKNQYGENFFEKTKPILKIHNTTLNYSFEVEINDYANSWYLHTNDSKSNYKIELGRRPIKKDENLTTDYIYITSSNKIETPNDHILFNTQNQAIQFRNIKTNKETQKSYATLSFMKNIGKIYDIYDLYTELYKNENNIQNLSNPSSHTLNSNK